MKEFKVVLKSEMEWLRVKNKLDDNSISYRSVLHSDSSFPGLSNSFTAELFIQEKDSNRFFELTGEKVEIDQIDELESESITNGKKKKFRLGRVLLVTYTVVVTALLVRETYINHRNSEDKNFSYSWSYDVKSLSSFHKPTNEVVSISMDKNRDGNFESIEGYSKGEKVNVLIDFDENGLAEKLITYSSDGRISSVGDDHNEDGLSENLMIILENNDTLKLVDLNKNGFWELDGE